MSGTSQIKSKKRDRSASEERLIKAGLEIFSKHGFKGATTRLIAKKADVNESLIARYFEGKEGLLIAITAKFIEEVTSEALPYPPQDTLVQELEGYAKHRVESGCLHEEFAKLVFSQALVDKKFKKKILETIPMQLDANLLERITRLMDLGKIRKDLKVEDICEHIDNYMDGKFFFGRILDEEKNEIMIERANNFVRLYARAAAEE